MREVSLHVEESITVVPLLSALLLASYSMMTIESFGSVMLLVLMILNAVESVSAILIGGKTHGALMKMVSRTF